MALADPYANAQRFRDQTGLRGTGEDASLDSLLVAVSRWMEKRLGIPSFNKTDTASALVLYPYGDKVLRVPPIASLEGVEVKIDTDSDGDFADETALPANDYELLPLDADQRAEAVPFTRIALTPWGATTSWLGRGRVQVTAVWGWPEVPEGIVYGCVEFARLARGEGPFATGQISELDTTIAASPQARGVLKGLVMVYSPTGGVALR